MIFRHRFLCLLLLFLFSQSVSSAFFPHPWYDAPWLSNNTNLYYTGTKDIWFPGIFNKPLTDLQLDSLTSISDRTTVTTLLKTATTARDTALLAGTTCTSTYLRIQSNPYSLTQIINQTLSGAWPGLKSGAVLGGLFGAKDGVYGIAVGATIGSAIGGTAGGIGHVLRNLFSSHDSRAADLANSCSSYGIAWKRAMDAAVTILDTSYDELRITWDKTFDAYRDLTDAGLCDEDYYNIGRDTCTALTDSLYQYNDRFTSAIGSHGFRITQLSEALRYGLSNPLPNTTAYSEYVSLVWKKNEGSLDEAESLRIRASNSLLDGLKEYHTLISEADLRATLATDKMNELTKQHTEKITDLAPLFIQAKNDVSEAQIKERAAQATFNEHSKSYLKNAIIMMHNSIRLYDRALETSASITEQSESAVTDKKAEAVSLFSEFESATDQKFVPAAAQKEYELAKKEFESATPLIPRGDRFEHFDRALYHIRFAQNIFEHKPLDKVADLAASRERVASLITRAEKDGIEISYEKNEFALLKDFDDLWVRENLDAIEKRILSKAENQYRSLTDQRRILREDISRGASATADLETSLYRGESGAFTENGVFDYSLALGNLKNIQLLYIEIEGELEKSRSAIVLHTLSKDALVSVDPLRIDELTTVHAEFVFSNPTGYALSQGEISFDLPFDIPFIRSDFDSAVAEVIPHKNGVSLFISTIEPYTSSIISTDKSLVLAHTIKRASKATGKGDGTALMHEEITFTQDIDGPIDFDDDALIDGVPYHGATLTKGTHLLSHDYLIDDAYAISTDAYTATKIGVSTTLRFEYQISPHLDLDTITVSMPLDDTTIKNLDVVSLTGEPVKNIQSLSNGLLVFDLMHLEKESPARVLIQYTITDATEYISKDVSLLEQSNLTDQEKQGLTTVKEYAAENDTDTALELLEKIKASVTLRNQAQEKFDRTHRLLTSSVQKELQTALNTYTFYKNRFDSPYLDQLGSWISKLNQTLVDTSSSSEESITLLESIDNSFTKKLTAAIKKDVLDQYASLKKRFLLFDTIDHRPESFSDLETVLSQVFEGNLDGSFNLLEKFDTAQKAVIEQEQMKSNETSFLKYQFENSKKDLDALLKNYSKATQAAHGSSFEYLFTIAPKDVDIEIKNTEKLFDKNAPALQIKQQLGVLDARSHAMETTLQTLQTESQSRLQNIDRLFAAQTPEQKDKFGKRITRIHELVDRGDYVNALKASDALVNDITAAQKKDDTSLIILGVTALFIIALFVAYVLKFSKQKPKEIALKPLRKIEK